jgi:hypothetical protein
LDFGKAPAGRSSALERVEPETLRRSFDELAIGRGRFHEGMMKTDLAKPANLLRV